MHFIFLTVVEFISFRRSGISALFGLWAELTMGLEGVGMLREPMVLVLGLRTARRSSLRPTPSPTPLGLLLGCADPGTPGPPVRCDKSSYSGCRQQLTKWCVVYNVLAYRSQSDVAGDGRWRHYAVPWGQWRKKVHQRLKKCCVCWCHWSLCQAGLELDSDCCSTETQCSQSDRQTDTERANTLTV